MAPAMPPAPDPALDPAPVAESSDSSATYDVTVRTYFPETWIWQLAEVGATGSTQVPLKVPDTITTWEMEAFCLSSKGFGLAPPAKATVFSYLSKCIMVCFIYNGSTVYIQKIPVFA
ncbi:pregnancy zone protein-like [Megalobrama amblycephala]|uniref:pregnancy zone protein-like n=1 Tax=Megalobrama amblycephala TaxID=75352 RepID=UPI002013D920|nr:pregnancy zone protein-like [Megalobrama amblycephala]